MNDDLFANIPTAKSPRLLWMEEHGITVDRKASSLGPVYTARRGTFEEKAECEHDALVALAIRLQIRLWNEK